MTGSVHTNARTSYGDESVGQESTRVPIEVTDEGNAAAEIQHSRLFVWDGAAWNRMAQPGGSGGGDGAILDGASPTIKATVFDRTNSNPVAVELVDTNGDPLGGSGGGDADLKVRNPGDTAWVSVGPNNAHVPVDISSVVHVDDNGGSLTVDGVFWQATQPVSGTFWQATQPVSGPLTDTQLRASAVPVDVSDRDARLLGRVKNLDSAGAVIDPALKGQLPAALVGGRLSVDASGVTVPVSGTFWQATQPVSLAAAVDVSDRAARLVGHVTVDNATLAVTQSGVWTVTQGTPPWTVKGDQARASATIPNPVVAGLRAAAYPTKPTAVAAGQLVDAVADLEGVPYFRPRTINTFTAMFRLALAAASSALAFTYVANTDKQLATIFHAVGSAKTVRIRRVWVELITVGAVAGQLQFELRRLTVAPATGNPAITPLNRNSGGAAVDATCLALPTTGGTDVSPNSPVASKVFAVIASEAAVVSTWPAGPSTIVLYDEASSDDEEEAPTMRPATAEGYAVIGRSTAAVPTTFMVRMVFTEE